MHLLVYIAQKSLSGTLVLWPPKGDEERGQDRVRFDQGNVQAAFFRDGSQSILEGLAPLAARKQGTFAFYDLDLLSGGEGVVRQALDPYVCMTALNRISTRDDARAQALASFDGAAVRIRPGADLSPFQFNRNEQAFIQLLQAAPSSVDELVKTSGAPEMAKQVLYLLTITRRVERFQRPPRPSRPSTRIPQPSMRVDPPPTSFETEFATDTMASLPPESMPPPEALSAPPPPPGLGPKLKQTWLKVAKRAQDIETENYFKMLKLQRDATPDQVNQAYFVAVKRWHPDRLPPELADLRPWADRIFHHLTHAKDTLSDTEKREEHVQAIEAGGGTPQSERLVNAIVNAAMEFQKVEVLMRRKEWQPALKRLQEARLLNPEDPDFHATEAEILLEMHSGSDAPLLDIDHSINAALKLNKEHRKALTLKARLLKRQGDDERSLRLYRKIAKLDPNNIEAAREVRLANMRESSAKDGAGGSILGKLFSRKKSAEKKTSEK